MYLYLYLPSKNHLYLYLYLTMEKLLYLYLQSFFCICPNPDVHRLQGCHIPIHKHVQKILEVSCLGQDFKALPFGRTEGYKDPPVSRRLVGLGQIPPNLSPTYSNPSHFVPETRFPDVHRLQGCHIPIHKHVQKILEVSCLGQDFKALPFGRTEGYKDPPVSRRLVGLGQIPPNLSPTYSNPSHFVPETRLPGQYGKIRTGTQTDFRHCRLPV